MRASGVTAMYRYVPNTHVRWRDALAGGLFVAVGMDMMLLRQGADALATRFKRPGAGAGTAAGGPAAVSASLY